MTYKDIIIISLVVIVISMFYLIMSGTLFHCSPVKCPNNCPDPMRSYLT